MTQSKDPKNFWSIIGKLALVLSISWILIQMYNNFLKRPDYAFDANGNHSVFELPNDLKMTLNEYINILAIDSALVENDNKLVKDPISSLAKLIQNQNYQGKLGINYKIPHYKNLFEAKKVFHEYKSYWWFTLTNTGNKPLEDLTLELPFDGFFLINLKNENDISGYYRQQIKIGELKPSYSVTIKVWSVNEFDSSYPEWDEEKTRFTHKYGWQKIEYPKEVMGVLAWNSKNNNFPLFIFIFVLLILFVIIFALGAEYGPKITEKEKKRKLKELEELEKLKAEEGGKTSSSKELNKENNND